jgi:hypothetical protein
MGFCGNQEDAIGQAAIRVQEKSRPFSGGFFVGFRRLGT